MDNDSKKSNKKLIAFSLVVVFISLGLFAMASTLGSLFVDRASHTSIVIAEEHDYYNQQVDTEQLESQDTMFEQIQHTISRDNLTVIASYETINDIKFPVGDVQYLNVNIEGNGRFRVSTHNENTIRLHFRGSGEQSYEFSSDTQTLNLFASDSPIYVFIPNLHTEPVFRDVDIQAWWGPIEIYGGSASNTYIAEMLNVNTTGRERNADIYLEDVKVSLFMTIYSRNSDIILRNVISDQNRLNVHTDHGNVYVLD